MGAAGRRRSAIPAGALDIKTLVLAGTSQGGRVAVTCAMRHLDLPAGLVLDGPLLGPGSLEDSLEVFERRGGPATRNPRRASSAAT
jgi:pimeloyl-ACP methyl ester carboxylesterase